MTTSSPKNYNYLALKGDGVDDMELVELHGMPAEYAYTPMVNEYMLDQTRQANYDTYIDEGLPAEEASMRADKVRAEAARGIKELLAKNGMLK